LSFVLREEIFRNVMGLPLAVALGVKRTLQKAGLKPAIKWPNDIYLEGKKCAGVLVEKTGDRLVVGIGLNVNQRDFKEAADIATSMAMISGREFDVKEVLLSLLGEVRKVLEVFAGEGLEPFMVEIESSLLFKGEEVVVSDEQGSIAGIFEGIDKEGALILSTGEGTKRILAGDVSLRPVV